MHASRYQPLLKIGTGGTATVYVGCRTGERNLVALKRLHPHLGRRPSAARQLAREARLAGGNVHENLIRIHGVESDEDALCVVMDYVEGGTLAELLAHGPMPRRVALGILRDALAGLAALHRIETPNGHGFIHRDVSPQNIFVGRDGRARLGDFGMLSSQETTRTDVGSLRGKLAYMAPELLQGRTATSEVDTFAFGVVAWETLTGRRLFRGRSEAETIRRVLLGDVPPPSELQPDLPAALDALVLRCLARKPEARFEDAAALEQAFRESLRGAPVATRKEVGRWVDACVGDRLRERRKTIAAALEADERATGTLDVQAIRASEASAFDVDAPSTSTEGSIEVPTVMHALRHTSTRRLSLAELALWADEDARETPPGGASAPSPTGDSRPSLRHSLNPHTSLSRAQTLGVLLLAAGIGGVGAWWTQSPSPRTTASTAAHGVASAASANGARRAHRGPSSPLQFSGGGISAEE